MLAKVFSSDVSLLYRWNSDFYWSNSGEKTQEIANYRAEVKCKFFPRIQNGGREKNFGVYFGNSYSEADFDGFEH